MTTPKPIGQHNYEPFAARYADIAETKPHNAYYERPNTLALLPPVDGLRVVDAGCGPGFYAAWLLEHGAASVEAFDVTPAFIEITRQRTAPYADRITIHEANLEAPLDFLADAAFDLVICPLVLDYIEDWGPVFREFYRVLKSGGSVVASFGHPCWGMELHDPRYFETYLMEMTWRGFGEPVNLKSYNRPLGAALNPIIQAGFILDRVHEPKPVPELATLDAAEYANLMQRPDFLHIRAHKP